jgi:uncharacterized protein (DUF2141 family)
MGHAPPRRRKVSSLIKFRTAIGSLALSILALAPTLGHAADCEGTPSDAKLTIFVEGVRSGRGLMTASLYPDDKSQFLAKNGALKVWRVPAEAPVTQMCIWLKAPGAYAVAIYHDANANYKLDLGVFGPAEDYGFTNNPRIFLSKPSFNSVRFHARAGETTVHIRLNHA